MTRERPLPAGARVRAGGDFGTVRWSGSLPDAPGTWIGIEWDSVGRGKHDGCAGGVRYFTAAGPESASFLRPQRLDAAFTCADALRDRYAKKEDEPTAASHKAGIDEWKKKIKVPFIEMIGFDSIEKKQGTLHELLEACVSNCGIWTGGDLASLCPSLRILDLSQNLLGDWQTVSDICSQLPHLNVLYLSKNRMTIPSSDEEASSLSKHFKNISKLSLAYCELQWHDVLRISLMCRNLEEIVLAYNKIDQIFIPPNGMFSDSLQALVLDGNPLDGWIEVLKLGFLKNLKSLSLSDCNLKAIKIDDTFRDEKTDMFGNVDTLYLKQNKIDDWRSISELNKLKSLSKLYFTKNPLTEVIDYETCYQFIIARIGNLKELNGSEVNKETRRGAEYDYLKKHGLVWKQLQNGQQKDLIEFSLFHSRFNTLVEKYELPDENLLINKKNSWAINTNLIELNLKDEISGVTVKKKLTSNMSVQKLLALVRRSFAGKNKLANSSNMNLYIIHLDYLNEKEVLVHLDNQMKDLSFYSISDGDTILVKW